MNQPDLGLKITELRQQKNLTQEKLAEYCDVSTRTIQRIESGDVGAALVHTQQPQQHPRIRPRQGKNGK